MTINDLAEVFHLSKGAIYNKISKRQFEVTVFKLGGRVVAETIDVAEYITDAKLINSING